MAYKYDPHEFWSSVDRLKDIRARLQEFPPHIRRKLQYLIYMAMEATRAACISTIEQEEFPQDNYERDMETDRTFLKQLVGSFNNN